MKRARFVLALCALLQSIPLAAQHLDFSRDVHPILAAHCFACHGGDKRSGGLSLRGYDEVLKGGRNGAIVLPERSGDSLLIQRVTATSAFMPPVGPRLTAQEIATLRAWIDDGARQTAQGPAAKSPWIPTLALVKPALPASTAGQPVDRFVATYLASQNLKMPVPVSDRLFARRAYLDASGLLPTPAQLNAFEKSRNPEKRASLVASLLADNRNYAENWISFWNDLLRNDEGVNYAGARKSITSWLYQSLQDNLPYDQFVERLLDPVKPGDPDGFLLGVNWRGDINASQTPVMQAAQNSAQVFLGINLKCNSCHDSFISKWKLKDAYSLAAFFSDAPELELVRCDSKTGVFTDAKFLYPELDVEEAPKTVSDRRAAVAHMFTESSNGRMPRTIVNRIWTRLLGRGLVADVDDLDGEPWSPELLDWLAADFVEHGYDLKHLIATIMTSEAYQLPAVQRNAKEIPQYIFSGPEIRRMTAEQFADALSEITGEWPVRSTPSKRGVYSREWRSGSTPLTRGLGRPIRDQVFTERDRDATTLQALELMNGETLEHRLARGSLRMLGELPPAPENIYDSGHVSGKLNSSDLDRKLTAQAHTVDVDITGVTQLRLLTIDEGSYSPERVIPAWANAVLVGPEGETHLVGLHPQSGQPSTNAVTFNSETHSDALIVKLPDELVYDITGKGYTRFRALIGLDDSCVHNDITPEVRFFLFREKPDPEQLAPVNPEAPAPPLHGPFEKTKLAATLFEYMLDRPPTVMEQRLASETLAPAGRAITANGVADLLWAIAMQPEFQLIY